jgi:hypothetical protein
MHTVCWLWTGSDDGRSDSGEGYGKFLYEGRSIRAHRVAYMLTHGEIPEGNCIMHMCDNPKCVNPEHLLPGTHKENMADKISKGRGGNGVKRAYRLLTDDQAREIYQSQKSNRALAREYGMDPGSVRSIKRGDTYKHATRALPFALQPFHVDPAYTPLPPQIPFQNDPYGEE